MVEVEKFFSYQKNKSPKSAQNSFEDFTNDSNIYS